MQLEALQAAGVRARPRAHAPCVLGASVPGSYHLEQSGESQDSFAVRVHRDRVALAIADGLGSAEHSGRGAAIAVNAAVNAAFAGPDHLVRVAGMIRAARDALEDLAGDLDVDLRSLACTLIAGEVSQTGAVVFGHVGDGAVVCQTFHGAFEIISGPGDSEYANEVDHLALDDWSRYVRYSGSEGVSSIAAFTDGCQRAALKKESGQHSAFQGFLGPIFGWLRNLADLEAGHEELEGFLAGKKLNEMSEDDKTLVLVRNHGAF